MSQPTQRYKRTLKGSIGSGMQSLMGTGRRYYILEHKVSSKYHKAGENQQIIVDQVELGRAPTCQVRFDESFQTVSRRHAAIVKDGDNWKLVQLSQTNSTFLNGQRVQKEWYLQNGDEIQLSVNGPKMGFITLAGKKGTVGSHGMTRRLTLFRQQALRPYKYAIACLAALVVLVASVASFIIYEQQGSISALLTKSAMQDRLFAQAQDKWVKDSTEMAKNIEQAKKQKRTVYINRGGGGGSNVNDKTLSTVLDKVKPSVFAVITTVYVTSSEGTATVGKSQGTGFLLDDGRFVTARHCVEPWMYDTKDLQQYYALQNTTNGAYKISATILAVNSKKESMKFSSSDFRIDRSGDTPIEVPLEVEGEKYTLQGSVAFGNKMALGNDWAYVSTSNRGAISDGTSLSGNLKSGTKAHLLGFPKGLGIGDGSKIVDPIYNELIISRDGLNDARCIMVNSGVDHGNSGGPVFVMEDKNLKVIGIVSRGDSNSEMYNHIVPMSNLK